MYYRDDELLVDVLEFYHYSLLDLTLVPSEGIAPIHEGATKNSEEV